MTDAKRSFATLGVFAALAVLACTCLASSSFAQDAKPAVPRFVVIPPHQATIKPPVSLPTWNGSFTFSGTKYNFNMVGTDPSKANKTTKIPSYIIPIKMVYDRTHGNKTFDPNVNKFKGTNQSVTKTIAGSPIFVSGVNFTQGGTNLGTTQYIDAFQRGNFWGKNVKKNKKYHVLLGTPTILAEQTYNCNTSDCSVVINPITGVGLVGLADINNMDSFLQPLFKKLGIAANTLPVFLAYDIYLTEGGCCIGGYHGAGGGNVQGQTYSYASTIDQGSGVFSQDTAGLSHEVGEWMDDPLINGFNNTPCGALEVGDPLVLADFPYSLNGFTYHLQDLIWMPYWGAAKSTTLHGWLSFQNEKSSMCS
jgi:hypothetical protein